MDRVIAYDGALPQTTDVLNAGKFALVGQAYHSLAILGSSTEVAGLVATPTSPTPDLNVTIGVGSIYQMDPTDTAAYGDLGVDNNNVMKQGLLQSPQVLSITPPATSGFSQVYLVQAILNDVDTGQMVLSYYNSADETHPFSGPNNSGTSNYTIRSCQCAIALKAGVAAATGTQATPTPDLGYVGLYAITVTNGQTQITSTNIAQLPTAPFFPTLPSIPDNVQDGSWVYAVDTGVVNALVVTLSPIPGEYVAGMGIRVKALVTNTSATTINVNGLGAVAIKRAGGAALVANDILSGQILDLVYDGVNFQMANYLGISAGSTTNNFTSVNIPYAADSGTQNAIVATFTPAVTSAQQVAGLFISVKLANTITGACTINVNGLGVKNVLTGDLANPPNNVYVVGEVLLLVYDGTQYQIVNTSSLVYRKPSANLTIYVNTALGNDANDGVSNTAGHALKTIQAGVNLAFNYAPSQYAITIVVEPGTYNESVSTPSYAGPNIVIDGLNAASVTVSSGNGSCFVVIGPNTLTVKNITVQNNGVYPNCGFASYHGATMYTFNTVSNACSIVFYANSAGTTIPGNHTFNGSGYSCFYPEGGGTVVLETYTYTIGTSISLSGAGASFAFAGAGIISINNVNPPTFVNPSFVNGYKFYCGGNGVISANGLGYNFFPGSLAGYTNTGGQALF